MCRISLSLLLLAAAVTPALAQRGADRSRTDPNLPASPPRPAPSWVKLIDYKSSDPRLAGFRLPEGMKLEIVSAEGLLSHPVSLTFSESGAPLVVELTPGEITSSKQEITYKDGTRRVIVVPRKKKKDAIRQLTSSKDDGTWDKATPVLEEEFPTTVLPYDGWLYVNSQGSVRRHKASRPGGPMDTVETIVKGIAPTPHGGGLAIGPDGWLYITCSAGDHRVEGSDGSRATVLRSGAVLRCRPDGSRLHTFAIGLWNPRGDVAFDLGGNLFHIDGDHPGGKFSGCRLVHIPEAVDLGWRIGAANLPDPLRTAVFGELPGKMPGLLKTGPGAPQGLLIYNDSRLPEDYRGLLLYPDPLRGNIRAYRAEASGASFKVSEEFVLLAAPKEKPFHPAHLSVGPDGALYILDRQAASPAESKSGRILRLSWSGTPDYPAIALGDTSSWSKLAKLTDDKLIESLAASDATLRERAARELIRRGDKNRAALIKLLSNDDIQIWAKQHAMAVLQTIFNDDVHKAFIWVLAEGDGELQRLAADLLAIYGKPGDRTVHDALLRALATEDRMLRRGVALAMGKVAGPGAGSNLATALSFDNGDDPQLRDGLIRAIESLGKPGIDAIIALADSGVQKYCDRVAEAFQGLRTRPAFDAILKVLQNPHLSNSQRADVLRSAINYQLDPPISLEAIAGYLNSVEGESGEVRTALLALLAVPGMAGGANSDEFLLTQLKDPGDDVQLAALRALRALRIRRLKDEMEESVTQLLLKKDTGLNVKREAVALLARSLPGARQVGQFLLDEKIPAELRASVTAALKPHSKDDAIAKILSKIRSNGKP